MEATRSVKQKCSILLRKGNLIFLIWYKVHLLNAFYTQPKVILSKNVGFEVSASS